MSEPNSRLRSGLFVTFGLGLLLTSILFFGGDRAFLRNYSHYKVKFRSTQGLASGSVVSISGIEVGNVEKITFDSQADLVAHLNIDKEYTHLLTNQSLASIKTQGALGDKYIYIDPGQLAGQQLNENDFVPSDTQPDLLDLISGKAADLSVFTDSMKEFNQLLHNLNSNGRSALLVENIVKASQNISNVMSESKLRESFGHLNNILKKVDSGEGSLGLLINDSTLHERLISILGDSPRNTYLKPLLREAIKQNENRH